MERVPGYQAIPTEVCRYWIAPESRQRARELLGLQPLPEAQDALESRRGA
jgi:hypothetical protein